ncbi:MAG: UV DNA damage repair endonuclease UvsE [Actinomycetota bacterium]
MRIGYACICLGREELSCKRTTVLRNATPERLRGLIHQNLEGLGRILRHNEERGIRLFRIGGEFIPFASHPVNELEWWRDFQWQFRSVGRWVQEHGHRLSFHASHFTILNSAKPEVVQTSIADLTYYSRVFQTMELGPEHKIIVHVGVNKPNYEEAEARFEQTVQQLPAEIQSRLVIENDERFFSIDRVAPLGLRTGLPAVVDVLHHTCLPGAAASLSCAELLNLAFETWRPDDGPPKIHFSSQDPDKKTGAHGYWIDGGELELLLQQSRSVSRDFDIMFEAKGKDLAVEEILPILREDPRFVPVPTRPLQAA